MGGTHEFIEDDRNKDLLVYVNGELVPRDEAKISVFDSGFLLGDGIWESFRLHNGKLAFVSQHLDRLKANSKALDLDLGMPLDDIINEVYRTIEANKMSNNVHIRVMITRYKTGGSILYYTWTPQWVSGILVPGKDVVWLTVPFTSLPGGKTDANTSLPDGRNIGFEVVKIRILANKKFLNANPAAKRFFELVKIPIEDISAQNLKMKNGEKSPEDINRHVKEWIAAHQVEFDSWIKEAIQAAK